MEEWMRALTCASYDYMRKAVSDLQRQLNELNAMARLAKLELSNSDDRAGTNPSRNPASTQASRVNPFNNDLEATQEVFPSSVDQQDTRTRRARTFEEMHFDIGEQIRAAAMKTQKAARVGITGSDS